MTDHKRYAAIDQGTTGTRVLVFDDYPSAPVKLPAENHVYASTALIHRQITPKNGWVEHDALEILENIKLCLASPKLGDLANLAAIGLSHQGESVVAWNADTGKPIYNAIVWQDLRTEDVIVRLKNQGAEALVKERTGLPLDAYFSATKIAWLIENIAQAKPLLAQGKLRIGTMDSFFIDHLCGVYCTDYNSASRTSLFNIHTLKWDKDLCSLFNVPIQCLAPIRDNIGEIGRVCIEKTLIQSVPLTASIVDQFAGIYGHGCRNDGDAKATFGTGAFLQCLTGHTLNTAADSGLLPTLCWKFPDEAPVFGLDGGVYNAASALNWARKVGLFESFDELDHFADEPAILRGLAFIPALSGLGCPYWDRSASGLWAGISLDTENKDLLQSILEGIAIRSAQVIRAMDQITPLGEDISIDGGLSANRYFKQFLANILNRNILSSNHQEKTALGTALLARKGLALQDSSIKNSDKSLNIKQIVDITKPHAINRNLILENYTLMVERSRGLRHLNPSQD
ncbi:glycerol kinase [Gammaproteobacteria bacterium]|nr:glycerol kinase [Gammaproteobacteria bacterium]